MHVAQIAIDIHRFMVADQRMHAPACALRLRFQEELSYKQISAVTGHSVSHVGVLIHDGIRSIRRRLAGEGGPHA